MTVTLTIDDGLATVTLARPDAANAFDPGQARALAESVARLSADLAVRGVLLRGDGPLFCGGGDVRAMAAADDPGEFLAALADDVHAAVLALHDLSVPVVCAVQGAAAGAGLALTLVCDLVIADADAVFLTAYSGLGLTPDCGMTWTLPRVVGTRRAAEMLLLNRQLTAAEALSWGLVTEVVAQGTATTRAREVAVELVRRAAEASGGTRRLIRDGMSSDLGAHLDTERDAIRQSASHPDARRLVHAYARSR